MRLFCTNLIKFLFHFITLKTNKKKNKKVKKEQNYTKRNDFLPLFCDEM